MDPQLQAGKTTDGRLRSRVAIVTGSDSGIGQATAVALAAEGASVAVTWCYDDHGAQETRE